MIRLFFEGTADASAGVYHDGLVWVLNDEDQRWRAYWPFGGQPIQTVDPLGRDGEVDAEACVLTPEGLWVCGSFGRKANGQRRPARESLMLWSGFPSVAAVRFRCGMVMDWVAPLEHRKLGLDLAAQIPVKTPEGLNIEGLEVHPQFGLLFGLRGPQYQGKAILLHLLNPMEVLDGKSPSWGQPLLWDLGGLGVRSLEKDPQGYWISVGPASAGPARELWRWSGSGQPRKVLNFPPEINAEGLVWMEEHNGLLVLSDDGNLFKDDPEKERKFQALWYSREELIN